jgi:hypothetical protein
MTGAPGLIGGVHWAGSEPTQRKKQMEDENRRLKQLVAAPALDREALKAVIRKTAGAKDRKCHQTILGSLGTGMDYDSNINLHGQREVLPCLRWKNRLSPAEDS